MDAENLHPELPEFGSLTEIMERFKSVPYDQFQKELNDWFYRNLSNPQEASDLTNTLPIGIGNLPALVSEIYHRAELFNALSEAKITTGNEEI